MITRTSTVHTVVYNYSIYHRYGTYKYCMSTYEYSLSHLSRDGVTHRSSTRVQYRYSYSYGVLVIPVRTGTRTVLTSYSSPTELSMSTGILSTVRVLYMQVDYVLLYR